MKKPLKPSKRLSPPSRREAPARKSETKPPRRARPPANRGEAELKTILVPMDFSPGAVRALKFAASLARRLGSSIVLVHVMDSIYESGRFDSGRLRALRVEAHEESRRHLSALAKRHVRAQTSVRQHLVKGAPGAKIIEMASRTGADLIVMGSEGRSGVKRLLVGSVAESVIREACCPVLVVRDRIWR